MNLSNEESNLSLFKPELSSQLLIQTNELNEFVQIPNICDDLLLTGLEDGTITWATLSSLSMPVLLNNQNDPQPLLVNSQESESLEELPAQQETLDDILAQNVEEFVENIAESTGNNEIVLPMELSDKSFLPDNELFITNVNDSVDLTSNFQLVNNDSDLFEPENSKDKNNLQTEVVSKLENEIQSSNITSQETFIDVNGILVSEQSVLNLTTQDFFVNIENENISTNLSESTSPETILVAKSKKKKKRQNQKLLNLTDQTNSLLVDSNTIENTNLRIINLDGTITTLNANDSIFNNNNNAMIKNNLPQMEFCINNEPDSTTASNENEEILNIDELATIVQTYKCRKCEFLCSSENELVNHFREVHINTKQISNLLHKTNLNFQFVPKKQVDFVRNIPITKPLNGSDIIQIDLTQDDKNENDEQSYVSQFTLFLPDEKFEKKNIRPKRKQKSVLINSKINKNKSQVLESEEIIISKDTVPQEIVDKPATKMETNISTIFLCASCSDEFSTIEECKLHYIEVHKYEQNSNKNDQSDTDPLELDENKKALEKFFKQDVLKKRKHKCPIKGCQYRFAKIELLRRHEACHINGTRSPFSCPECKEKFNSWRCCSIHLWICHKVDIDFYTCPLCDYKGSTYDKIKHHIKIHCAEREYICPECGKDFKQPAQLRNHRIIHIDKKNLQDALRWYIQKSCETCGKIFSDAKCLKKHIQAVHSKLKPFICNVCGHSCARKAMLQLHLRQHTGDKPYSCNMCLYKTGDHNSLRRHLMRHTGSRPYKCPYCDYAAIQSNSYKNHIANKHPGKEGFFKCSECSFKFVNEDIFNSHRNSHKIGLISNDKETTTDKLQNTIHITSTCSSDVSSNNDTGIFAPENNQRKKITQNMHEKSFEMEDDETQNCLFSSLNDLTDEQTVDTGGITIPADPDDPDPLNL